MWINSRQIQGNTNVSFPMNIITKALHCTTVCTHAGITAKKSHRCRKDLLKCSGHLTEAQKDRGSDRRMPECITSSHIKPPMRPLSSLSVSPPISSLTDGRQEA